MPTVSIIIVNYHSHELIDQLLIDLENHFNGVTFECLISDNDTDSSYSPRAKPFPVIVVRNNRNLGFGKAINECIKEAQGEFLIFMNPDIRLLDFQPLRFLEHFKNPKISVLAPRIFYPDGRIQPNGGGFTTPLRLTMSILRCGAIMRKLGLQSWMRIPGIQALLLKIPFTRLYSKNLVGIGGRELQRYDWVSGAFMAIRKDVFVNVNGFDESFFMYCEDEDLCRKIRKLGLDIFVVNSEKVSHAVGATGKRTLLGANIPTLARMESSIVYLDKHTNSLTKLIPFALYFCITLVCAFINALKSDFGHAKSWLSFAAWMLRHKRESIPNLYTRSRL